MSNIHPDGCDECGRVRELYHNEDAGLAFCDDCDAAYYAASEDDSHYISDEGNGAFHAELRNLVESHRSPILALHLPEGMVEQAEALLALPEESVAALVAAAQSMTEAASFGR